MSVTRCAAETRRGTPCQGIVPLGRAYCLVHDPELADKVQAARRRGGTVAMKLKVLQGKRQRLETPRALVKFLSDLMVDVLAGSVDPNVARTVAYTASVQRQLLETSALEDRLAALEAALEEERRPKWAVRR